MKYILVGIFLFISSLSFSQDRGFYSEGREFLLGYLHNPYIDSLKFGGGGQLSINAIVSSNQKAKLQVSYYDASGKETSPTPYTLKDNNSLQIPLTRTNMMHANYNGDVAEYTACHITSDVPVTVSYMSYGQLAFGSYLALPIVSWGKKYVVESYNDHPGYFSVVHQGAGNMEAFYSCGVFTIVGAYNGTKVQITPTALTRGGHVGVNQGPGNDGTPKPYTIELNKGQCYLVKSASAIHDGTDDISGTMISADKPIGVIAGHQDAAVGDGNSNGFETDGRDFMIEQLVPVEFWDNKGIYTIPMLESKGNPIEGVGENYRVYVSDVSEPTGVQVFTSATTYDEVYPRTFEKVVELANRTKPLAFASENEGERFSVTQYELRSQWNAYSYTAPSMTTIVPRSQWKNSYTWRGYKSHIRYADAFQSYYVTVIADANNYDNIKVAVNGGNPLSIHNALNPAVRTWSPTTIPGSGNLKAVTYGIDITYMTSYYAYSDMPFMVYQFGYSAADGSGDLGGQIESEDYFGTDAHPAGMRVFDKTKVNRLSVNVDTLCNGWNICVTEG
ncbi:MAG TPA: IgGFc-binding protein, partial [Candidatus Kapabacteria bacterium]